MLLPVEMYATDDLTDEDEDHYEEGGGEAPPWAAHGGPHVRAWSASKPAGGDANGAPARSRAEEGKLKAKAYKMHEQQEAFMRPASGNTFDLRPATSCGDMGGRRTQPQDHHEDPHHSSETTVYTSYTSHYTIAVQG
eukprot:1176458-Prorocentrum_minimum.AAC.2